MSFLKKAIENGIRKGIGDAIGNAVKQAIEPKATQFVNETAKKLDKAAQETSMAAQQQPKNELESALFGFERAAQNYATQAGKNIKICESCGESVSADKSFCPHCGSKLPEKTLSDGAICPSCGKQNTIDMKFCADCGAKLPIAIAEEEAQQRNNDQVITDWKTYLPQYPLWNGGGTHYHLEAYEEAYMFSAKLPSDFAAQNAIKQYRRNLEENGFRMAGQYPNQSHLYKMIDGQCYHVDLEHCFDGDQDQPTIYFDISEPTGGFHYVKPEPKKQLSWKDLLKF